MIHFFRTLLRPVLLPALLLACTSAGAVDRTAAAQTLLLQSGLSGQLGAIEPQVRAGLAEAMSSGPQRPSAAEAGRIAQVVTATFAAERLRETATRVIAAGLQEEHLGALQAWYASPTGLAVARLEAQATAEQQDMGEVMRLGQAALAQSTPRRRELLGDLLRETQAAEAAVELALNTAVAIQRGFSAAVPDAPQPSTAEIEASLAPQRAPMLQAMTALAAASMALTYQRLSEAELAQYLQFTASAAGRHFNALGLQAVDAALTEATETLGRSLPGTRDPSNT